MQRCWRSAVDLAQKFVPARAARVTATVGERLSEIGQHAAAAELFVHADMPREAINAFMDGGMFDRAYAVADSLAPSMREAIDARRAASARSEGTALEAEIEAMANRGDWRGCLKAAEQTGSRVTLNKYVVWLFSR